MAGKPKKKSTGIVNAAIGALAVVLAILIVWMMNLVAVFRAPRVSSTTPDSCAARPSVSSSWKSPVSHRTA